MKKALSIRVYGKVQNVGFRYHTRKVAEQLGITGFVKNQPDGSVYIEAEGDEHTLDQFLSWCNQGPALARVDRIETQSIPEKYFTHFTVR